MGVNVDEPRRQSKSSQVDHLCDVGRIQLPGGANGSDAITTYRHVSPPGGASGAVDQGGVA
jgi:hypothetical protein